MLPGLRKISAITSIAALLSGCIDPSASISANQTLTSLPDSAPGEKQATCTPLPGNSVFDLQKDHDNMEARLAAIRARLLDDQEDLLKNQEAVRQVVAPLLTAFKTYANAVRASKAPGTPVEPASGSSTISGWDIQDFVNGIHQRIVATNSVKNATKKTSSDAGTTSSSTDNQNIAIFSAALGFYLTQLFQSKYVDRFGNSVKAPTASLSITDDEIAAVVKVLFDVIGDFLLRSPVWIENTDKSGVYYPAASNAAYTPGKALIPTAVQFNIDESVLKEFPSLGKYKPAAPAAPVPAVAAPAAVAGKAKAAPAAPTPAAAAPAATAAGDKIKGDQAKPEVDYTSLTWTPVLQLGTVYGGTGDAKSTACSMTERKFEVVELLSGLAGKRAGAITGLTLGSAGGFGFSLGVFGKVSIGDNKTLEVIMQTMLTSVAEQIAADAALHAVYVENTYKVDHERLVSDIVDQLPKLLVAK